MRSSRYSTLLRILLALVACAGLLYWAANMHDLIETGLHFDRLSHNPFEFDADDRKITKVAPEAAHSGIVVGDTLESLNGESYTGLAQWAGINNVAGPGDTMTVGYKRSDGSEGTATITLAPETPQPGQAIGSAQVWQRFALFGVMPLLCMLIGYWVVIAKPAEVNAWLLMLLLVFPEVVFLGPGQATGGWLLFRGFYYNTLQISIPLMLLPFAIYFPERSRIDVKVPWLKWIILGPAIFCGCVVIVHLADQFYFAGAPSWIVRLGSWTDRIENFLNLAIVILYFVIIVDKLRSASTADARRRLRVLLVGTGVGLGSLLVAFVLVPNLGVSRTKHPWIAYLGAALFMIAPLTLAYVVLVQRALDVRVLLRQGTKYGLAKATVWTVQFGLMAIITVRLLLPLLSRKQEPSHPFLQAALFVAAFAGIRFLFRKRSMDWIDKRFFREAYNSEQVLSQLADDVRKYTDSEPLLKTVAKCVAETLHVTRIGMLMRSGPDYTLQRAVGAFPGGVGNLALAATSSTIRNLGRTNAPAQLYRQDPDAWYMLADQRERETLDEMGAELLLPLPGRSKLMGVMALGPKQSEAAYSKSDLQMLQILATQTGMALEMSELAHSLANEAALRERANREMEIAREVQERLFPQEMPKLERASVAGACRPALGVGGDYYDVFPLEDGRLGLAIGDVSGKGISAALLMASLRASLRGVTLDNPRDFAKLMDKVNRLVYEASADNRYATFFFGALDPVTCVLECVNAGHNAPLVLRQKADDSHEILRLEADGPVVGLLPFAPYTEQRLQLQSGDLLVTYTDGISEAMTHDDEEWGEERMMLAAATAPENASASEVLRTIFAQADKFTAGAPQHDDMTLLILKLAPDGKSAPAGEAGSQAAIPQGQDKQAVTP